MKKKESPTRGLGPRPVDDNQDRGQGAKNPSRFRGKSASSPVRYSAPPPGPRRVLERVYGESVEQAIARARVTTWWPLVKNQTTNPHATERYWIWMIRA